VPQLDSFIKALFEHRADALALQPGAPAALKVRGADRPITRDALSGAQVTGLLREVLPAEQAGALGGFFRSGDPKLLAPLGGSLATDAILARAALVDCSISPPPGPLQEALSNIAWGVNQQLPRKDRKMVWDLAAGSRCRVAPSVRAWLRLHKAVGALEAEEMAAAAGAILSGPEKLSPRQTADLLAARMAGLILTGRSALAQREFTAKRGRIADDEGTRALFRLLVGAVQPGPAP